MNAQRKMTPRERIKKTMDFQSVDAIPWAEDFYVETLNKFFSEGLPAQEVAVVDWELEGITLCNWPKFIGFDAGTYFGCINLSGFVIPVDIGPIPRFKQRRIGGDERYDEFIMQNGAHARRFKKGARENVWYNMPQFQSFPVTDKKSWESYKQRLILRIREGSRRTGTGTVTWTRSTNTKTVPPCLGYRDSTDSEPNSWESQASS